MILYGPPGCGKTTLVNILHGYCNQNVTMRTKVVRLSAAVAGLEKIKEEIEAAKTRRKSPFVERKKTILFLDEIHRFNKLQQDVLLPCVEQGILTLIGATTQNPSFALNSALLSRCSVVMLEKLDGSFIEQILDRALYLLNVERVAGHDDAAALSPESLAATPGSSQSSTDSTTTSVSSNDHTVAEVKPRIAADAVQFLSNACDGDARIALNSLQLALRSTNLAPGVIVDLRCAKQAMQKSHLLYDRDGDQHFDCISALHKSIRGSDANAALYWLGRMLEGGEDPKYVARRLIRIAGEDVGLADPQALTHATAAAQSVQLIGMPECDVILAQVAVYLARAPKSIEVYAAYGKVKETIKNWRGPMPGVPLHLRNAPTKLMKDLGCGKDYKYNPDFEEGEAVDQRYLPVELEGFNFFDRK